MSINSSSCFYKKTFLKGLIEPERFWYYFNNERRVAEGSG